MKYQKGICVLFFLTGLVGTQAYPTTCEGVTEEQVVLLPTPENCSTYIQCHFEEEVVMPCPGGLHWNDLIKQCDFPGNANCKEIHKSRTYNNCNNVPSNNNVLLPNPNDCGSYIQCVHGNPLVRPCPAGLHWSAAVKRCEWPEVANCRRNSCEIVPDTENVIFPNPDDCGTYIQCVHQKPVVRPCPVGLHWSASVGRCEWPDVARCDIASRSIKTYPIASPTSCEGVKENETVLLPNPGNCSTYIECAHGKPVVMPCPEGLKWNDVAKQCDYPEIAQCKEQILLKKNWTSCEGVPENETVLLPNPGNCSTYIECAHGKPVVMPCPEGLQWNDATKQCDYPEIAQCKEQISLKKNWTSCEGVPENETVLLPNHGNCSTYIECAHGKPVVMPCPEGLQWNDAAKQCDYPGIAQCKEQISSKKNWTSCEGVPENETVLLPNHGNCSTYIECAHGKPVVMPCPEGLKWNDAAKQCDYPGIAQCKEQISLKKNWTSCEGIPENETVLLPNHGNCSTYIECAHGKPVVMPCPEGLQWNDAAKQCDYPGIAQCKEQISSKKNWTSCEGVPENETVLLPNHGNCSTYIECAHGKPVVMPCPEGLKWNDAAKQCDYPGIAQYKEQISLKKNWTSCEGVPENETVLLPNHGNCSTYIECAHGKPVVMPCPEGLKWNDAAKQCDYPGIAQCKEQISSKKNWTSCEGVPENETVLLPNHGNCSTYIECAHGKPVVMPCPEGLKWNDAAKQCDYPGIAQCKEQILLTKNWTSCEGVPENETVLLPNHGNCSTYIECAHEKPVVMPCPEGLQWNDAAKQCDYPGIANCKEQNRKQNRCEGVLSNKNVLLPNPKDCGSYIQCVHGKPLVRPCPSGLYWSVAVNRCEWPEIANCKINYCENVAESQNVLLPNPEDCGTYIQCVHQRPVVRPCPAGLHWSVTVNRCDWPQFARCAL